MSELKRDEIKYIRDLSKSAYKKDDECYICGAIDNLQFHHFYSMTELWNKFKKKANIKIESVDDILVYRDEMSLKVLIIHKYMKKLLHFANNAIWESYIEYMENRHH